MYGCHCHPPPCRATPPGHSLVHAAPACETGNFQQDTVSLQGLVGATISHSAVHPMLLPTWGAGPHPGVLVHPGAHGHMEQSLGPAAPGSCSFLPAREADENINFTEQRPPLQSSQRAGSIEKCWVQLDSNQNQIKTREKGSFPAPGTPGESWDSGEPGMGIERPPVSWPGPPLLGTVPGGSRARGPVLAPRPTSRQASLPGQGDAGCRLGHSGAVLQAAGSRSPPCHGAVLGRGSGCRA